jgi:8-oxo-dGTP pyrophosphatase MutT (NUDIX family)
MKLKSKLLLESDDAEHYKALRQTGFWGRQGAGAIIMAKDTGRILLPFRSATVEQPHTFGVWGGAIDNNEKPIDAVKRETKEEIGYNGNIQFYPLYVFQSTNTGFKYHNFLGIVDHEFKPNLNWETDNFIWVKYGDWPNPLHFGLKALIQHSGNDIKHASDKFSKGTELSEDFIPKTGIININEEFYPIKLKEIILNIDNEISGLL